MEERMAAKYHQTLTCVLIASLISTSCAGKRETLFFSAYIEGSGYNKAYSIYNPTGNAISLNQYAVVSRVNYEFNSWNNFTQNAILNSGTDYVICDEKCENSEINSVCNEERTYMHNGDDAYYLVQCDETCGICDEHCINYQVVDMIGNFSSRGAPTWEVCGTSGATAEHSLFRKPSVCEGSDWSTSSSVVGCEWDIGARNTGFEKLGFHETTNCTDNGGRSTHRPTSAPVVTPTMEMVVVAAEMCPEAPAQHEDRRTNKNVLKIAQWNMDFLMLPNIETTGSFQCPCATVGCADTSCSDCANCCGWGRVESRAHLRYVALELLKLNADVIHVAEVSI
jgi:hypothetical protein